MALTTDIRSDSNFCKASRIPQLSYFPLAVLVDVCIPHLTRQGRIVYDIYDGTLTKLQSDHYGLVLEIKYSPSPLHLPLLTVA